MAASLCFIVSSSPRFGCFGFLLFRFLLFFVWLVTITTVFCSNPPHFTPSLITPSSHNGKHLQPQEEEPDLRQGLPPMVRNVVDLIWPHPLCIQAYSFVCSFVRFRATACATWLAFVSVFYGRCWQWTRDCHPHGNGMGIGVVSRSLILGAYFCCVH